MDLSYLSTGTRGGGPGLPCPSRCPSFRHPDQLQTPDPIEALGLKFDLRFQDQSPSTNSTTASSASIVHFSIFFSPFLLLKGRRSTCRLSPVHSLCGKSLRISCHIRSVSSRTHVVSESLAATAPRNSSCRHSGQKGRPPIT